MEINNHKIFIREMTLEDARQVFELDQICFTEAWSLDSFEYEMSENKFAIYYISETEDKEIVGYCGLWQILDEGHITNVAVKPEYRGSGLAQEIVATLIRRSMKSGIKTFTLEVRKSNQTAINLYKKFGFIEAGIRKGYYSDNNEDALIMWRHND
jgi:[ribosomal protein S18]-alanine N-acetyltransferase